MTTDDNIGASYAATRQPDPRIGRAHRRRAGRARSVINVGAGTGYRLVTPDI
ncbi:MAG: hypothetical protein ACLPUO_29745 [Streptosporangiaceae bacterium]|jgi:hypothetical protein